ncbi:MAG: hypothetical protein J7484_14120 [Microbacterium sp.]|nr:hypothetical protein [Microbacterium sp.]
MSTAGDNTIAQGLLPGVHRPLRTLDAAEGPLAGVLVGDGRSVAVLVGAESLRDWTGWVHAGAEHVAGPRDLVRRRDGVDVLLPRCIERVSTFLGRRAADGEEITSGEATTLVASLIRGLGELGARTTIAEEGEWWLTGEGRPLFVPGTGSPALGCSLALVRRLAEESSDRVLTRVLRTVADGLEQATARKSLPVALCERWEAALLDVAAPKPLRRAGAGGEGRPVERAQGVWGAVPPGERFGELPGTTRVRERERATGRGRRRAVGAPRGASALASAFAGLVADAGHRLVSARQERLEPLERSDRSDRGVAMRSGAGVRGRRAVSVEGRGVGDGRERGGLRRRSARMLQHRRQDTALASASDRDGGARRPRSRRSLAVAGAAAVAVLVGGLLWPTGATGEPRLDESRAASERDATTGPTGSSTGGQETGSASEPDDGDASSGSEDSESNGHERAASPRTESRERSRRESQAEPGGAASPRVEQPSDDPTASARELYDGILVCGRAGDAVCADAVATGSAEVVARLSDGVGRGRHGAEYALVDAYGDVAVVRMTPSTDSAGASSAEAEGATGELIIVLVREKEKWLVRDVYDVADQPS